ncbi:MAG: 60S ribosomal export protein NMD3 [Halohasta sp.]
MSESRDFCPRCGDPIEGGVDRRPGEPRTGEAVLCDSCYFDDFELIDAPERVQVTVCGRCGAVHRGNRWLDLGAVDYTDVAVEAVSEALSVHIDADEIEWGVEPEQVDETTIRMHCSFSGAVRGTPIAEQRTVPVRISKEVCDRCGRIAGGYYASIVQVRAEDRPVRPDEADEAIEIAESYVANREQEGDREAFITSVDRSADAGPNIKLSTNKLGQAVAARITDRFGGTVDDHPTLVTEDGDGNEVYRVTFVARLPKYTPGDVVDPEDGGGPVVVTSAHGQLKGRRLLSGERYEAGREAGTTPEVTLIGRASEAVETTVVAVEDDHAVQVLDPETYEAKTVSRPDSVASDTETVRVLKHGSEVYVLPEETV